MATWSRRCSSPTMDNRCVAIGAPRPQSAAPAGARLPARRPRRLPALPQGRDGARSTRARRGRARCPAPPLAALLVLVLQRRDLVRVRRPARRDRRCRSSRARRPRPRSPSPDPRRLIRRRPIARADTRRHRGRVRAGRGRRLAQREPERVAQPVARRHRRPLRRTPTPSAVTLAVASTAVAPTTAPTVAPTEQPTPKPTKKPHERPLQAARAVPRPARTAGSTRSARATTCTASPTTSGISLAVIYDWNPQYAEGARLRKGDEIRMPPPTR